jgi:competence protein ComEC
MPSRASLPGAFGRVTTFGTGPLLLGTAALLVIGLLKIPLRWSGAVLAIVAVIWAARTPLPDVLPSADGRTFAVRGAGGRLAFHQSGGDTFAIHEWLAADADGRDVRDPGSVPALPVTPPAASASSPTAVSYPTRSRPRLSRRIAGARCSS